MIGHTRTPADPVYRCARVIDDWIYAIKGSRERQDHRQAADRLADLRFRLNRMDPDTRRAALDYYKQHKGQVYQ